MRSFAARFPGTCVKCRTTFPAGTSVHWQKGVGAWHVSTADCTAATAVAAAAPPKPSLALSPLVQFLAAAKARGLKFPKARFLAPDGRSEMLLSLAGPTSQTPGALVVKVRGFYAMSVLPSGEPRGPRSGDASLAGTLIAIAVDPAAAAKAYGALTCSCSFCGLPLTDEGSVEVGYGPVCAKKWGLPHVAKGAPVLSSTVPTGNVTSALLPMGAY